MPRKIQLSLNGSPTPVNALINTGGWSSMNDTGNFYQDSSSKLIDPETINNSLSQLRLLSGKGNSNNVNEPQPSHPRASTSSRQNNENPCVQRGQIQDARTAAENAIIEAEHFKARIQQPNRGKD